MDISEVTKFKKQADLLTEEALAGAGHTYLSVSDAMLRGAKMRPQAFGELFANGKSCALGAMLEGWGERYDPSVSSPVILIDHTHYFRVNRKALYERFMAASSALYLSTGHSIVHMNDHVHMTRERIAAELKVLGH